MTTALTFSELLERAGARPARYGRRWWCAKCDGRTPALAADLDRELYFCHRCGWKGGRRTLERGLGIRGQEPTPMECRKANLIHGEAERFTAWVQARRIAKVGLLRIFDKADSDFREKGQKELAAGEPVSELVWARLEQCWRWQERAVVRYRWLCDFERNAGELYREYRARMQEAA